MEVEDLLQADVERLRDERDRAQDRIGLAVIGGFFAMLLGLLLGLLIGIYSQEHKETVKVVERCPETIIGDTHNEWEVVK